MRDRGPARVAKASHERGVARDCGLRKHAYRQLREAGAGAQAAQHVVTQVCDAYRNRSSSV